MPLTLQHLIPALSSAAQVQMCNEIFIKQHKPTFNEDGFLKIEMLEDSYTVCLVLKTNCFDVYIWQKGNEKGVPVISKQFLPGELYAEAIVTSLKRAKMFAYKPQPSIDGPV